MYYPYAWNVREERDPSRGLKDLNFYNIYDIPNSNVCDPNKGEHCSNTALNNLEQRQTFADWFTNFTLIPGEATLPEGFDDPYIDMLPSSGHPWFAPGTAPLVGNGCGVNGGNPDGCGLDEPYGTCCGNDGGCGGYAGGRSALEQAAEGLFDDAFVTVWQRGQVAEVYWNSGAKHRGGYAYRLCEAPNGDISKVTEECFQAGHLDFVGDKNWIGQGARSTKGQLEFVERDAQRTREGTYPPGSQWTRTNVPAAPNKGGNWSFKDLVQVPQDLKPGVYVLSHRWDCERTPQVWNSCATIHITE